MLLAFALGLGALAWLAYRLPTAVLALVLLTFAVGARWVLAGHVPRSLIELTGPTQAALLLAAMTGSALRHGVRGGIRNWPLVAVGFLLLQSLVLAEVDHRLRPLDMVLAAYTLALPWVLVHLVQDERGRPLIAATIGCLPLLSTAIGFALEAQGLYEAFGWRRLQGATNSGWLGALGYVAFAVCLHEGLRSARSAFVYLAALNVAITILSAGRMAVFACAVHAGVYCLAAPQVVRRLLRLGPALFIAGGLVLAVLVRYLPVLEQRMTDAGGELNMSGRDQIWAEHFTDFLRSPLFGRGLGGSGLSNNYFDLPHNEYLRLLVEGGLVGATLFALALVLWTRDLLRRAAPDERPFLWGAFVSLAVFATTDNVLIMPPTLLLFAYLAFLLPAPVALPQARRPEVADRAPPPAPEPAWREPPWRQNRGRWQGLRRWPGQGRTGAGDPWA